MSSICELDGEKGGLCLKRSQYIRELVQI